MAWEDFFSGSCLFDIIDPSHIFFTGLREFPAVMLLNEFSSPLACTFSMIMIYKYKYIISYRYLLSHLYFLINVCLPLSGCHNLSSFYSNLYFFSSILPTLLMKHSTELFDLLNFPFSIFNLNFKVFLCVEFQAHTLHWLLFLIKLFEFYLDPFRNLRPIYFIEHSYEHFFEFFWFLLIFS